MDGRYNIDNNAIENAIRPLALGRLCAAQHNLPYVGKLVMLAS
ncbi:MAG: transposase [Bacteroidales bacterium]|nr:transposase [Bacteroidales bacterium]